MQQAREVAVAGLQPVEGVRVLPWQLTPARGDMGCCGSQCSMWQLPHWDMWCCVGVPTTTTIISSALWQQPCGRGLWGHSRGLGRSSRGEDKGDKGYSLQLLTQGRETF